MLWGSSGGGFYRGRGGGEWPGEAEKRPVMGRLQWPSNSGSSRRVKARLEGGGGNGQGVKEEGEGLAPSRRAAMAVEARWRETETAASVRLEEEEGRSGHVGQTGQQAGWLAGLKAQVGPAERLRPSGEGEASRLAGPKAEWAGKGSWAESEK
jgi:hypothetical protein